MNGVWVMPLSFSFLSVCVFADASLVQRINVSTLAAMLLEPTLLFLPAHEWHSISSLSVIYVHRGE